MGAAGTSADGDARRKPDDAGWAAAHDAVPGVGSEAGLHLEDEEEQVPAPVLFSPLVHCGRLRPPFGNPVTGGNHESAENR